MRHTLPVMIDIINDRPVTAADGEFIHALKQGLLLALREQGVLNDVQLRIALERMASAL